MRLEFCMVIFFCGKQLQDKESDYDEMERWLATQEEQSQVRGLGRITGLQVVQGNGCEGLSGH